MTVVSTQVLKFTDAAPFEDRWPLGVERVCDSPVDIVVLEGGMQSGAPSVAVCADLPGPGQGIVIEMSWAAFHLAHEALNVAVVELP